MSHLPLATVASAQPDSGWSVCLPPPRAAGSLWVQSALPQVGLGPSSLGQVNVTSRMDGQLRRVAAWPPQPRPHLQTPALKPAVCQAAGCPPTSPNHGPHTGCLRFSHSAGRPGCLGQRGDGRVSPGLGCTPQAGRLSREFISDFSVPFCPEDMWRHQDRSKVGRECRVCESQAQGASFPETETLLGSACLSLATRCQWGLGIL